MKQKLRKILVVTETLTSFSLLHFFMGSFPLPELLTWTPKGRCWWTGEDNTHFQFFRILYFKHLRKSKWFRKPVYITAFSSSRLLAESWRESTSFRFQWLFTDWGKQMFSLLFYFLTGVKIKKVIPHRWHRCWLSPESRRSELQKGFSNSFALYDVPIELQ